MKRIQSQINNRNHLSHKNLQFSKSKDLMKDKYQMKAITRTIRKHKVKQIRHLNHLNPQFTTNSLKLIEEQTQIKRKI